MIPSKNFAMDSIFIMLNQIIFDPETINSSHIFSLWKKINRQNIINYSTYVGINLSRSTTQLHFNQNALSYMLFTLNHLILFVYMSNWILELFAVKCSGYLTKIYGSSYLSKWARTSCSLTNKVRCSLGLFSSTLLKRLR